MKVRCLCPDIPSIARTKSGGPPMLATARSLARFKRALVGRAEKLHCGEMQYCPGVSLSRCKPTVRTIDTGRRVCPPSSLSPLEREPVLDDLTYRCVNCNYS